MAVSSRSIEYMAEEVPPRSTAHSETVALLTDSTQPMAACVGGERSSWRVASSSLKPCRGLLKS